MLKLVLSTWACELSIKQPPNAFPLNRSISFVFFTRRTEKVPGFHESSQQTAKTRAKSEMKAVWVWPGAELAERCILRCNENGFPRASHPRIHSDRIGHLQHTSAESADWLSCAVMADLFTGAGLGRQTKTSLFFMFENYTDALWYIKNVLALTNKQTSKQSYFI